MLNLSKILKEIEEEAEARFLTDPACPGGKTAKLYTVAMEIDIEVGKLMVKINEEE